MKWAPVLKYAKRVWVFAGLAFTGWMVWSFQAHGVDPAVSQSNDMVTVSRIDDSWRFVPNAPSSTGLVFLPGGLVSARAYFPLARDLAERGYAVVLVELPYRSAPTPASERAVLRRARRAIAEVGSARQWVLAGHSKGAAIATRLIRSSAQDFAGLVLIGTTHPRLDLSDLAMDVMKIGGTQDCVAPRVRAEQVADSLPPGTDWIWIEGANHAQFGWYGPQLMDCEATISRFEQQAETRRLIEEFLSAVSASSPD